MSYAIVDADYVLKNLDVLPIVDVRPADMYAESRIPHALSVPLMAAKEAGGDVAETMARGVKDLGIDCDAEVIVYCHNGGLAREACDLLASKGFTGLHCYAGSWIDWIACAEPPVERGLPQQCLFER